MAQKLVLPRDLIQEEKIRKIGYSCNVTVAIGNLEKLGMEDKKGKKKKIAILNLNNIIHHKRVHNLSSNSLSLFFPLFFFSFST